MREKIRYRVVILVALIFIASNLISQTENIEKKISLGFETGVQFTKIYDSWAYSNLPKSKTGFNAGLFADYKFSELVKARVGLYYDNRGFINQDIISPISEVQSDDPNYRSFSSYFTKDLDYTLNYLTIPLSIFYTKGNDKFSLFLQGSIYYSILLNASRKGSTNLYIDPDSNFEDKEKYPSGLTTTNYNDEDVTTIFNGNDWGVQIFFGAMYHINQKFSVHLTPGFTVAFENLYADPTRSSKWNSIYKINAGIIYNLK